MMFQSYFLHGIFSKYALNSGDIDIFRNYRVIKRIWYEFSYDVLWNSFCVLYPFAKGTRIYKHTTCFAKHRVKWKFITDPIGLKHKYMIS